MFRKRYVATAILIFLIGVVFGICMNEYDDLLFRSIFIVLAALSVVLFLSLMHKTDIQRNKIIVATAFAVAFFSFGVVYLSFSNMFFNTAKVYDECDDNAVFEIVEINENYLDSRVIKSKIGLPKGEIVRFYPNEIKDGLAVGDSFNAETTYKYTRLNQHRAKNISLLAYGTVGEYSFGNGLFYNIRKHITNNCDVLFDDFEYASSISKAVIVGERSGLDSYIFTIYKTSGISHILAISGLHISIITMCIFHILSGLRIGQKISSITAVIVSVGYTALVGFIPGAVRSSVMMSIMLILSVFFRNSDRFTTLFISLLILIIENPYSICSAGLQLSFLCTLGIILFAPLNYKCSTLFASKLRRAKGLKFLAYKSISSALSAIVTATAASLFSFPVLCMSFDTVSYISPIVNIAAVPLFTYAVVLSSIALLISLLSSHLGLIFAYPAGFLYDFVTKIARFLFNVDVGVTSIHTGAMLIPLLMSFVFIAVMLLKPTYRLKRYIIFSLAFSVAIYASSLYNTYSNKDKAVLEYGCSSSVFVYISYKDKSVYVDLGGYTSNTDVVFENGFTDVKTYVLLDYNSYSFERLNYFTSNVRVEKLLLPKIQDSLDVTYVSQIKELANERKCDILFYNDSYSQYFSDDSYIEIFGDGDISDETLICVNILGKKIQFLGEGFDNAVVCDIAVAMDGYSADISKVYAEQYFALSQNTDKDDLDLKINVFKERLKFKFDISEREYKVYES